MFFSALEERRAWVRCGSHQDSGSCPFASAPAHPTRKRAQVGATASAQ